MKRFGANEWRYRFVSAGADADAFEVIKFEGSEYLSECFRFQIQLMADDPSIPHEDIVNSRATLTMRGAYGNVPINGIIAEFRQGQQMEVEESYEYTAILVPSLWRLKLSSHSRIFQDMTVDEIVGEILTDSGITASDFEFDLGGQLEKREYTIQYNESDFDFVSRLLEHEGIYYYFEFEGDRDILKLTDQRQSHISIDGDHTLEYIGHSGRDATRDDGLTFFDVTEHIVTGKVILNDYNYLTPANSLTVDSEMNADMPGEQYEFGDHHTNAKRGKALAKIRNEELECQRRHIRAKGVSMYLRSGFLFSLDKHFRPDLNNQEYLVLGIHHKGSQEESALKGGGERGASSLVYENNFTCMHAKAQFRPARNTAVPKVSGIMSGVIESSGGDYADIDDMGRYRVRMMFDTGDAGTAKATRPIRMAQPHSGPDYGIHFPNHANTEMIWACINGDPDRPIALGTVPNPKNTSPSLAKNKAENIIRTKAGNQMVMDDTVDKARILINTPDANRMVFDDSLDNIIIETTNKHKITLDDKNKRIEIKSTNGHFIVIQDGKGKKEGKITIQSEAGHRISINDKDELITLIDESGDNFFQIDIKNKQLTIKTADGGIELLAENGVIDIKAKTLNIETSGDTNVTAGGKIVSEATMDHEMTANNVKIEAKMNLEQKGGIDVKSEAGVNHEIKGTMVKSEGSAKNDVAGAMVSLKGSVMAEISGGLVKIN